MDTNLDKHGKVLRQTSFPVNPFHFKNSCVATKTQSHVQTSNKPLHKIGTPRDRNPCKGGHRRKRPVQLHTQAVHLLAVCRKPDAYNMFGTGK